MSKGKVSIVMPFYKAEAYVERMIKAIQSQTYSNWELVAVSNGSCQETQNKIVSSFAKEDPRIKLICTNEPGVSNARNLGISIASGKWLVFVDADDFIEPNHIQNFMSAVDDESELIVMGYTAELQGGSYIQKIDDMDSKVFGYNETLQKYLSYYEIIYSTPWNKLFARDVICQHKIQFDRQLTYMEDALFCLHVLRVVRRVQLINKASYHYVVNTYNANNKYHACLENVYRLVGDIRQDMFHRINMPEEFLRNFNMEKAYLNTYFLISNQYKKGAEKISANTKVENIRRWINSSAFQNSKKWYMSKNKSSAIKLFNLIISCKSPYVIHVFMHLLYKSRNIIQKIR